MSLCTFNVVKSGERLLTYLRIELGDKYSNRQLRWLIEHQRCKLNGFIERFCSVRLKKGDVVHLLLEELPRQEKDPQRILFEDDQLLFYNKPAFLSSEQLGKQLGYELTHRLDRDTSGVILLAKNPVIQKQVEELFAAGLIYKRYLAWICPPPKLSKGSISLALSKKALHDGASIVVPDPKGKEAVTDWKVLKRRSTSALVYAFPKTGRTHQIRAHFKALGSPIVGDAVYGGRLQTQKRPLLHAQSINFELEGKKYSVQAPLPEDFS
ncbi:MAG: RluA family pseudouridine synthase [Verrucomicrobia bacterium]|nr:RluA family pseudouridine synthase [Verrucomicrobiota bacterium]MBS0646063.1 RluA family pseudouridine synthase [Verrucomicrobiota bacterium]